MRNGEDFRGQDLQEAERAIGYTFGRKELLKQSLTHSSWSNLYGGEDNERLEFLGDAVLELIVTETLFLRTHSNEGTLTGIRQQYVSQAALEEACDRAELKRFLRYSGGEKNVGGKTASNLFEAVLGAIYLDGGMEEARKFLQKFLTLKETENFKSLLQEYVQEKTKGMPLYEVREKDGGFECVVKAMELHARGEGNSKKSAETEAAKALYEKLTEREQH